MRPMLAALPLAAVLAAALAAAPLAALDTVYLIRHAEKVTDWPAQHGTFQPLSDAGHARAVRLAARFAGAGIAGIYTSLTARTFATAVPLAKAAGLSVEATDATTSTDPAALGAFLDTLRRRHAGDRAVLIVGHQNTVPLILLALGAEEACYEALDMRPHPRYRFLVDTDETYDNLWRVDLARPGCAGMRREPQEAGE